MAGRRLVVSGRVQGVWFRQSCRREADRLGVAGWVRNLPDGRVEVVAEGDAQAIAGIEAWARHGPPDARVDAVDVTDVEPTGVTSFDIRH